METIEKIVATLGVADIGSRLEIQLMDGIIRAFQEQSTDDTLVILNGFGTIINNLGMRAKPYFAQVHSYNNLLIFRFAPTLSTDWLINLPV